jgi:YbbR domain-containing protein
MIGGFWDRLVEHWELKLVALVIAVALWLYTNGQVRVERTLNVVVNRSAVQSLPADYRVNVIEPQGFTVKVSVPMNQAGSLRNPIVPNLIISGDAVNRGEQSFPITSSLLGLDDDLRIERIEPETVREVRVAFALITEDYLPVEVPVIKGLPDGIQATLAIEPTRVRVRGTREQLDRLKGSGQRLVFDPIVLDGVDPTLQVTRKEVVALTHQDQNLEVIDRVTATVTLSPQQGASREVAVPVQLLAPKDFTARFTVEFSQPQVVLALHGPASLLGGLQPETELTAYVALRPTIELGVPVEVPVGVMGPSWATYDPVTIRVTVNLAPVRPGSASPTGAAGSP